MRIFGFTGYGGPDVTGYLDVDDPAPATGQVVIRTAAVGINPADVKVRSGLRRDAVPVTFPMAVGREAAGRVVAVGPDVDARLLGAAVFGATATGTGALGELTLLDVSATARRPDAVPVEVAASIPVAVGTAYDAVEQLDVRAGETLLVIGAGGGVGSAACDLARDRGAAVIGVASGTKAALVESRGARHVVSGDGWVERAREIAPHCDALLDLVGGDVLRAGAELVPAMSTGSRRIISPASPAFAAELGGGGVTRRRTSAVFAQIAELVGAGRIAPAVTHRLPLARAAEALALVESGHAAGNIVVTL